MVEILGVDLSPVPNLALEIEESVRLSSAPSKSWIDAFRAELQSAGIPEVAVITSDSLVEFAPRSFETKHLAQVKRTIQILGESALSPRPLMPLIRKAADVANLAAGPPHIEVRDAELGASEKVCLLMDVPVEVSAATASDFKRWSDVMIPLILVANLATSVRTKMTMAPTEAPRFYLVLKQVRHEYAGGGASNDHGYLAQLRQLARLVDEGKA